MHLSIYFAVSFVLAASCWMPVNAQWVKETSTGTQFVEALFAYEDKLYVGSDTVLYIKTAGNPGWEKSSPLPAESGAGISCLFKTGSRLFAGTWGQGIYESTDDGSTWIPRNNGFTTSSQVTSFVQRDQYLYAGTEGSGIFAMDLNSAAPVWSPFRNGLSFNTGAWSINSIYNYAGTLISAAGQSGYIYFNESFNDSWYDLEFAGPGHSGLAMWSITGSGNILLGTANNGIYRSTDNGVTWGYFNPVLGYIGKGKFAAYGEKIFTALTMQSYGTIIYSTKDSGISWDFENNLPGILTLDFTLFSDHLYIAAFDGLWYKPLNPSSVEDPESPDNYFLHQNYPNPFNPSTKIRYSIPSSGFVTLKVYDALGKEIAVLVNENKQAGTYEADFNASELTSGVYFYQLSSEEAVQVKKMMVVK